MVIPYAKTYTATATGSVLKVVVCEKCAAEYVYRMTRQATGSGTSMLFVDNQGAESRASSRAEQDLRRSLERECDPIPCPSCGWFQDHMIPVIRKNYRHWMYVAGMISLIASIILIAISWMLYDSARPPHQSILILQFASGVLAVLGAGLLILRPLLAAKHDPNALNVDLRKLMGQQLAMLRKDLERLLQEQEHNAGLAKPDPDTSFRA